jgi:carbamoyltransferase
MILGVWDGHDSGAAIICGDKIVAAINEERLTRRKLEIRFPEHSIEACLRSANIQPRDIDAIAVATSDFSKTLARIFPYTKEEYYLIRRRKKKPGILSNLKKRAKYMLTEISGNALTREASLWRLRQDFRRLGLGCRNLTLVDHHLCHAAAAGFCSGFDPCLVITIDGIGDALSGTISTLRQGRLERLAALPGQHSLGIFFEHVTNLLNMRELEDEGKVMALANYAYPVADDVNPLLDFMTIDGLQVRCKFGSLRMYDELARVLWHYPSEQFAYMAQRTLEVKICELVRNCIRETGVRRIALAGGVFSNIKVNMRVRMLPEVEACYVFPHMGDGGLALGAAMVLNYEQNRVVSYGLDDIYWGPAYTDEAILKAIQDAGFAFQHCADIEAQTARLIAAGNIVFWLQGRMEYGPRALGNRSILALPNSLKIRDVLNLRLKMRVWYQPFCPSLLEEDARKYLEDFDGLGNRFMTMGYMVPNELRADMQGVLGVDGSCRPQIVTAHEARYARLLNELRSLTGSGVVLNTSFNVHGEPLVCSPADALATLRVTGNEYLVMGNYLVSAKKV